MWRAPELTPQRAPREQLLLLRQRWQTEERAVATVLAELEHELDEAQRDHAYHRLLGEPRADLAARGAELRAECEVLAAELAQVQIALAGLARELGDGGDRPFLHRTPA